MSESFGKYREWQHWLSIWTQLLSSLVGAHKHVRTMTDAHTYTQLSVVWVFRGDVWILHCTHVGDASTVCKHGVTWNPDLKIGHFIGCTASSVIVPMYQSMRPALAWQPETLHRWWTEKCNCAQNNYRFSLFHKRLLVPGVFVRLGYRPRCFTGQCHDEALRFILEKWNMSTFPTRGGYLFTEEVSLSKADGEGYRYTCMHEWGRVRNLCICVHWCRVCFWGCHRVLWHRRTPDSSWHLWVN